MGRKRIGPWPRILPFTIGLLLLGPWRALTPYAGYVLIVQGYPYMGATLLTVAVPITAVCFLIALPPPWARRWARRHSLDLDRLGHVTALLILLLVLLYLLGGVLSSFAYSLKAGALPTQVTGFQLVRKGVINLILMGGGAIAYTRLVYGKNYRQTMELLMIKRPKPIALLLGAVTAGLLFILIIAISQLLALLGIRPENPVGMEIARAMSPILIVVIPALAAVSEELFFRGFLQSHVGLWGSAVLFGIVHLGYGSWLQVVMPFIFGMVWGLLLKRTRDLAAPITSHFVYDFTALAAAWMAIAYVG